MMLEPENSLWQYSLSELRTHLAAATPTPGGGAVAAVTATLAAALLRMVAAISRERIPNPKLDAVMAEVKIGEEKLAQHADEDVHAFDLYMAVRKNRAGSPSSIVQEALIACARVPLEAAEEVVKLKSSATEIAAIAPAFLASDLATANHLLHASLHALLANVAINLSDLENCDEKRALQQRFELLVQGAKDAPTSSMM